MFGYDSGEADASPTEGGGHAGGGFSPVRAIFDPSGLVEKGADAIGSLLTGGPANVYDPAHVNLGNAPQVSEAAGAGAINQEAAIQQGAAQRAALGMASGTGSEASRLGAINAGGQASAGIGAQAAQARAALYQQIQSANAGMTQQRDISREQLRVNAYTAAQANTSAEHQAKMAATAATVSGVAQGVGSAIGGMHSDERMKEGVHHASSADIGRALHDATDEFGGVEPVSYRYKADTGLPTNRRIGVMAQDMEHTGTVSEDGGGRKKIDMAGALSLALAASADLHDRVEQLESRRGGKRGKRG